MADNYRNFRFTNTGFVILRTIKTYSRTASGKSWKTKPDEIEQDVQSAEYYTNYIQSIPFFNNWGNGAYCRGHYNYTQAGYLPTEVVTVSPYQQTKKVATFEFLYKPDMERKAGWREKEVMEKATEFSVERYQKDVGYHRRIELINPKDDGVTHSATWDTYYKGWVN